MRRHSLIRSSVLAWLVWAWAAPSLAAGSGMAVYQQAVDRIVAGFDSGTAEPFNQALDVDSIADKATDMVATDPEWIAQFRIGLKQGINPGVGERLLEQMAADSYVKLLRLKLEGDQGRALLRFDFGEQGNGYIDLFLVTAPDGTVGITDWYDYAMGQRYTSSLRQMAGILAPSPTLLGKLYDVASDRKEAADTLKEIFLLYKKQEHAALVQKFLAQDESVRRSRVLNLIAIHAANSSGDMQLYHQALANLEQYHGDDDKLFFILLDYYFLEQKFDRILTGLDRLASVFGPRDAALEVIRSNAMYAQGDYAGAGAAATRAVSLEPDYEYGYWSQLMAHAALGDYAGGVNSARALEERFGYDMGPETLAAAKELAGLAGSEAYRNWRAGH